MVGKSVDKNDEIRAYIKARSKHGCSLKQLMNEFAAAYRHSTVSYDTVRRWKKIFDSGVESMHRNQVDQILHLVKKIFPR